MRRWVNQIRVERRAVAGLLGLSFLWALSSLRDDLLPNLFPEEGGTAGLSQMLPFALAALLAGAVSLMRGRRRPTRRQVRDAALVGLSLFVVPAALIHFARGWVSDLTRVALFSLIPLLAVVLEPHFADGSRGQSRGGLAAALIAVAGTLCVFPLDLPRSVEAAGAFLAVVAAAVCLASANCWAVRIAEAAEGAGAALVATAALTAGVGSAGLALGAQRFSGGITVPRLVWAVVVDLPALLLLFWLMRGMSAARMTTRFLIAPLLVNLMGVALLRPAVSGRAWFGLVLIAGGAGWLLLARGDEPEDGSSLLKLDEV